MSDNTRTVPALAVGHADATQAGSGASEVVERFGATEHNVLALTQQRVQFPTLCTRETTLLVFGKQLFRARLLLARQPIRRPQGIQPSANRTSPPRLGAHNDRVVLAIALHDTLFPALHSAFEEIRQLLLQLMDSDFHAHRVSLPWPSFLPSRLPPQRYYTLQRSKEQEQVVRRIGEAGIGSVRLLLVHALSLSPARQAAPWPLAGRRCQSP